MRSRIFRELSRQAQSRARQRRGDTEGLTRKSVRQAGNASPPRQARLFWLGIRREAALVSGLRQGLKPEGPRQAEGEGSDEAEKPDRRGRAALGLVLESLRAC